jgi:hypothetical protein
VLKELKVLILDFRDQMELKEQQDLMDLKDSKVIKVHKER